MDYTPNMQLTSQALAASYSIPYDYGIQYDYSIAGLQYSTCPKIETDNSSFMVPSVSAPAVPSPAVRGSFCRSRGQIRGPRTTVTRFAPYSNPSTVISSAIRSSSVRNPFPSPPEDEKTKDADRRRSAKERRRNMAINAAFNSLQNLIPFTPDQKLAKIKTLNLATKYIQFLNTCLQMPLGSRGPGPGTGPLGPSSVYPPSPQETITEFANQVELEVTHKNSYTNRLEDYIMSKVSKEESPETESGQVQNPGSGESGGKDAKIWSPYS